MKKIIIVISASLLLFVGLMFFSTTSLFEDIQTHNRPESRILTEQTFDPIVPIAVDSQYISYTTLRQTIATASATASAIESATQGKLIRIDTAEELYWFSIDVSYNVDQFYISSNPSENVKLSYDVIDVLLSLNYVLGNDIDYSVMKAKQFIPIGFNFFSLDETPHKSVFTGTFDGRGFQISNLYFAGYDYITTVEGEDEIAVDLALSEHYAMFTTNEGTIKNVGLINPTLELLEVHEDINQMATLVGLNTGTVENVYVIDTRTNAFNAGMRIVVPSGTSANRYTAAGIVYDNQGTFKNSYFAGNVVVNGSYINNFFVQPVLYYNSGIIDDLVYDSTIYLTQLTVGSTTYSITPANAFALGESTTILKSYNSSLDSSIWYFYELDTYPILLGLSYVNMAYQISTAMDLIAFSKVINFSTVKNSVQYRNANYVLTTNINMSQVGNGAYKTPNVNFSGTFSGAKEGGTWYIANLNLVNGRVNDNQYYSGLFNVLSGSVHDITLSNSVITLNNTQTYPSATLKVGIIAGELSNGTIENVSANVSINLGTTSIGRTYVGGIVGQARGTISGVYVTGTINGNTHTFNTEFQINTTYYMGGIVGGADGNTKLTITNVLNEATVNGIATTNTVTSQTATANIAIGGIIGFVQNTSTVKHHLSAMTNSGTLVVNNFMANVAIRQNVGGIFGLSQGNKYTLDSLFGDWKNEGTVTANATNASTTVRAAGIGVSNHSENVEYIYLENSGTFTTASITNFKYTALIYDISTTGVTLSQAVNHADFTFTTNYPAFSAVFFSEQNAPSTLRFVENKGDLTYNDLTLSAATYIAGITLSTNINFLNVYYSGTIRVYNISSSYALWISGITTTLTTGKYLRNSLNDGKIIAANINSTQNTYIGGLVNQNQAGNLQTQDDSNTPVASSGIINSINYADISSTQSETIYGFYGLGNLYASGIATLNSGSIQDTANLGDVTFIQLSDINPALFSISATTDTAGRINSFVGGITVGGIVGAVVDGTSRIYDAVNSGDIIGIAKNYVRSGGILAVALTSEVSAGGVSASSTISNSILSNCINYGNVSAITQTIATYTPTPTTQSIPYFAAGDTGSGVTVSVDTRIGTQERPPIYSCAGGVIGYGLSVMRRMVNHGGVSATDVAGGIIGATYVLGTTSGSVTTRVNIDTAIHYGSVQAFNNSEYDSINEIEISYSDLSTYFYEHNNTFIFPITISDITRYPESKRGFGGVFGRLQRGTNGIMTSEDGTLPGEVGNFNFIVNTDLNVDLIGRLDQVYNFTSSGRYFRFNDCIYFSARENDTTQAVFTGFVYQASYTASTFNAGTATQQRVTTTRTTISGGYRFTFVTEYYVPSYTIDNYRTYNDYEKVGITSTLVPSEPEYINTTSGTNYYYLVSTTTATSTSRNAYPTGTVTTNLNPTIPLTWELTGATTTQYVMKDNIPMPIITEDPLSGVGDYIYDEYFFMRDDETLLSNGESITSYIFYVEGGLLTEQFQTTRPNGMYVLSTTAGSSYGSVIPANMNATNIYRLTEPLPFDIDYEHVPMSYKDPFTGDLETEYTGLFQTLYNDKSALIETDQTIYLDEIDGSDTTLITPDIDYVENTITYEISLEAFDSEQTTASYRIMTANIPVNALIGARIEDYMGGAYIGDVDGFRQLLYQEKDAVVAYDVGAILTIDFSSYLNIVSPTDPISMGYFVSYSEAALNNAIFMNSTYETEYEVFIILKPKLNQSTGSIDLTNVVIDGVTYTPLNYYANKVNTTIQFQFADTANLLVNGTDIKNFVSLYYGETLVDQAYYALTSEPVNGGLFSFTFTLSTSLKSGVYTANYRYFSAGTTYEADFEKAGSSVKKITNLAHYSYNEFVEPVGLTFTTYINFGVSLDFTNISWQQSTNGALPIYLHNTSYTVSFLSTIVLSPFATIEDIIYVGYTFSGGYKTYEVNYVIQSEDETENTYIHYITEREIDIYDVFKNNNSVAIDNVVAAREADNTIFALSMGIDSAYASGIYNLFTENPDAYFSFNVTGENFDAQAYTPEQILGLSYSTDVLLYINMSYETLPGYYYFELTYTRESQVIVLDTILTITKQLGINAYLTDIRFSESATETSYAKIYASDASGNVIIGSPYVLRIYFAGIDYDNSDVDGWRNFRVDGQVANTPLNEYSPYFLDYLPYGATISRRGYDMDTSQWFWTNEVNASSPDNIKALLATDFTVFPDTGQEGDEDNDVTITYRVTSEDEQTIVYYHISVVDIVYNVSIIFTVYYVENDVAILARDSTELFGKTIIINVRNFNTDVPIGASIASTVASFPSFTQVTGYNNNTTQFFVPYSSLYRYRFGRNISGFYNFNLQLPKDSDGLDLYEYYITFNGDPLNDVSDYIEGVEGQYYYIETGTKNRTRRFNIYVSLLEDTPSNPSWGLTDYFYSWDH